MMVFCSSLFSSCFQVVLICLSLVSFPCGLLHDIYIKKSYPYMVHPLLPVPRLYRNLAVIPG